MIDFEFLERRFQSFVEELAREPLELSHEKIKLQRDAWSLQAQNMVETYYSHLENEEEE